MSRSITPNYFIFTEIGYLLTAHDKQSTDYYFRGGKPVEIHECPLEHFDLTEAKLALDQLARKYKSLRPMADHIISNAEITDIKPGNKPYSQIYCIRVEAYPLDIYRDGAETKFQGIIS